LAQGAIGARLAPEYFATKLVHKIFWHNVGIGFSVSRYFQERYGVVLSDASFLTFVAHSPEVAAAGDAGRRVFWAGTYTGQWVGGDPEIPDTAAMYHAGMVRDFAGYERFAREVVIRLALRHPWWTTRLFLYDKPKLMLRQILNAAAIGLYTPADLMLEDQAGALLGDQNRRATGARLKLFSLFSLLAVAVFGGSLVASGQSGQFAIAAAPAILIVTSTVPLIATYPLIHLMASLLAVSAFSIMIWTAMLCANLFGKLTHRPALPIKAFEA
jgi:hypothetical protein